MAKDTNAPEAKPEEAPKDEPKGLPIKKLIIIGVPLLVVQLGLLWWFVIRPSGGSPQASSPQPEASAAKHEAGKESKEGGKESKESGKEGEGEAGAHMYVVKDLIVNPSGTNGTRFLLTTIGFETSTAEGEKELEKKDIQVRDALNSVLTTKGLDQLASIEQREALRAEIQGKIGELLKTGTISNVYFSKFIIQ
jgi:flagellar FliL protein